MPISVNYTYIAINTGWYDTDKNMPSGWYNTNYSFIDINNLDAITYIS